MEKVLKRFGREKVTKWCAIHGLKENIVTKMEPNALKLPKQESSADPIKKLVPPKNLNNSKHFHEKKTKGKSAGGAGDEIDDIFNSL